MNPDGSNQALIHSFEKGAGGAKWSEDMSMIVFSSSNTPNDKNEIFLMDANGSNVKQLTNLTKKHGQSKPRFYGSNKIWWTWHGPGNGNSELYEMNLDGSGKKRLTHFTDNRKQAGLFDFGDSKVFYYKQNNSWSPTGEIYSADINLNNERQLTHNKASDGLSDVSSDGTKVLFSRAEASNGYGKPSNIYKINADGTHEARLTSVSAPKYCGSAIFSPNGNQIVYYYYDGSQSDIWVMNSDGSLKVNITNTPDYNEYPSDWRKDKVLFSTNNQNLRKLVINEVKEATPDKSKSEKLFNYWRKYSIKRSVADNDVSSMCQRSIKFITKTHYPISSRNILPRATVGEENTEITDAKYLKHLRIVFSILEESPGPLNVSWDEVSDKEYYSNHHNALYILITKSYDVNEAGIYTIRQKIIDDLILQSMRYATFVEDIENSKGALSKFWNYLFGDNKESEKENFINHCYYIRGIFQSWPVVNKINKDQITYREIAIKGIKGLYEIWQIYKDPGNVPKLNKINNIPKRQEELYDTIEKYYNDEINNLLSNEELATKLNEQKAEAIDAIEILMSTIDN